MLIAKGHTSREISSIRTTSIHTVRHQVKAAMEKLSVHRQLDLAKKVQSYQREP